MINVFQPCLGEEEVSRIREVFQSNWLGKGWWTSLRRSMPPIWTRTSPTS